MLTKCLALELASACVRVNAFALREDTAALDRVVSRTPMGRFGTSQEIAGAVLFLTSDESSSVTGTIIYPDGGTEAASR
jgi:glucose 1-dehydrogenase